MVLTFGVPDPFLTHKIVSSEGSFRERLAMKVYFERLDSFVFMWLTAYYEFEFRPMVSSV